MLREYMFFCEQCNHTFSIWFLPEQIVAYKATCKICGNTDSVYRDFKNENILIQNSFPKTLGMLADKNSKKHSNKTC